MNSNGREIEFTQIGDKFDMWVERDCAPFDDYVCGSIFRGDDGFYRFHPEAGVVMSCKMLREAMEEVSRLNCDANAEIRGGAAVHLD